MQSYVCPLGEPSLNGPTVMVGPLPVLLTEEIRTRRGGRTPAPVLVAAAALPDLAGRERVWPGEVDASLVTGSWRRLVFACPELPCGCRSVS